MASDDVPEGLVRPVRIISEEDASPSHRANVTVHYFENGNYRTLPVIATRPTYFDTIVVSAVSETTNYVCDSFRAPRNVRDLAFNALEVFRRLYRSIREPVTFSTPILDLREIVPNNMAHLLIQVIPYYFYARRHSDQAVTLLLRHTKGPFAALLETLGIQAVHENRRVAGEILKIRGTRGLAVFDLIGTFDTQAIDFFQDVYEEIDFPSHMAIDRIFLARRPPRNLVNQTVIEKIVESFGYKTIFLEDYPIRDQLSIGAHAKHVIAIHGAAMSVLHMNKRITSLIELFPPNVYQQIYALSLGQRVIRYDQIISEFDVAVPHSGWAAISSYKGRNFSVDAALIQTLLADIHSRSHT